MYVDFRTHQNGFYRSVHNVTSLLLRGYEGSAAAAGIEYVMHDGTAWTFAVHNDKDFFRILGSTYTSGLIVPGEEHQCLSALCVPALRKGIPTWYNQFKIMTVRTDDEMPLFIAVDKSDRGIASEIEFYTYGDNGFDKKVKELGY